jgi:hypothetical protein
VRIDKIFEVTMRLVVCLTLLVVEIAISQEARVVRALYEANFAKWTVCINHNNKTNIVRVDYLTNQLAQLNLHHGDILMLEGFSRSQLNLIPSPDRSWLTRYDSTTNQVTVLKEFEVEDEEFLNRPVYHWVAPYDDPRSMTNACFFYQGKALGKGMSGYQKMLANIVERRLTTIYLIGSAYKIGGTNLHFLGENPYKPHYKMLEDALAKAGTGVSEIAAPQL